MAENQLPAPAPVVTAESKEFWDATAQGKLLLPRCQACGVVFWYPRPICSDCGSTDIAFIPSSGRGTIYTYTVNRRGTGDVAEYKNAGVFVLAYVQLEEGPCMLTNIVDCDPDSLSIGQPVEVVFHDTGQGSALPRFRPAE
jgi:uncharacterized OB-fold protein